MFIRIFYHFMNSVAWLWMGWCVSLSLLMNRVLGKLQDIAWNRKEKQRRTHQAAILGHSVYFKLYLLPCPRLPISFHQLHLHRMFNLEQLHHCSTDWFRHPRVGAWIFWTWLVHSCWLLGKSSSHAIVNVLVGFALIVYIILPISYWANAYYAKKFPIFSSLTFDSTDRSAIQPHQSFRQKNFLNWSSWIWCL